MTFRGFTLLCYVLIVLAGVALEFAGSRGGSRIPTLSTVVGRITRTRSGRVGILAGWAWLGMHFLAR